MEGQVLLTNYDLDPGGSNPNAIATGYYQAHHHHHNHHPELEHLAQTMPKPTVMNSYENETNNNGSTNSSNNNIRSQSRMSISHDKGLLNMPGQNNCFLNSAVQVLWHLDIFRRSFRELHGHACMGDSCIFCALKELFNQFQSSTESALPPDSLRFALSQAFSDQRRFQIKEMDDAAECFENILFRIHYHITNRELDSQSHCLPHCIPHQKFSMNLYEQIVCYSCGATSDPFLFSQMVHYTSTSALCVQQQIHNDNHHHHHHHHQNNDDDNKAKFGQLLKKASSMGDIRNCPKMCGARMNIKKILLNRPDIISIGLVWDTDHPSISFIKNVYHLIETEILLSDIFDIDDTMDPTQPSQPQYSQSSRNKKLDLVGLVTYYGKHYSTYIFNTKLSQWIYFDDATVRVVGQHWQQVVDKCIKGHFQPLLLFYSNPNATSINTQYASSDIIPMTIIKKPEHVRPPPITTATSPPTSFQAQKHLRDKIMAPSSDPNLCLVDYKFNHKQQQQQQQQQQQPHSDVPDSPSATSTTSYFSEDVGDSTDGYISRKTVENIIKIQQRNSKKHQQQQQQSQKADTRHTTMVNNYNNRNFNRNSSSSLESFDSVVRQLQSNVSSKMMLHTHSNEHHHHQQQQPTISKTICSLQRRDSGNSSGDRASSASSNETPYYPQKRLLKMSSTIVSSQKNPSLKNVSDQGYDSFSLSSSDSYPSTAATSPSKLNSRLKQIPEDVQLIDMVNNLSMDDCDKLCSEADILLLRSHEKEREGDLRAAAALSDSAAAKARSAMDIPYSNHQTLISAKMKHSMCVMRSASLHKRLLEMEVEEKRLLKAAMQAEQSQHHSRQSSRDSSHGRHSRQGSRDGKDVKSTKDVSATITASTDTKTNAHKDSRWPSPFNLEIYATLPKKVKRKSQQKDNNFIITKSNENVKNAFNNVDECQKIYENVTIANQSKTTNKSAKSGGKNLIPDSDFSDYHSEWEAIKKKKPQFKIETQITYQNGWQSCRENDSEGYAEFGGTLQKPTNNGKKQCKVKRKLMFGNFLKTKNRSLPDLREEMLKDKTNEGNNNPNTNTNTNANQNKSNNDHNRCSVANINAKGFHQSHRSFVAEQGFKSKPLLIKVKPPLLSLNENSIIGDKKMSNINIGQHQSQPPTSSVGCSYEDKIDQSSTMPKRNLFLEELNRKRSEILKFNGDTINNREDRPTTTTNASVRSRSSDSDCNPNLFSSTPSPRLLKTASPPVVIKKPSLFEIANLISKNRTTNPNLCHNQPLESIIIQNHGHNQEQWPSNKSMATPIHSNLHVPIPVNPVINTTPAAVACGTKALRMQKPPDYETTLKRIEMNNKVVNVNDPPKINSNINNKLDRTTSSPQQRQQPTSSSPSPIYSNMSSLQTHKLMRDIQPEYEKSTISNGLASAVSTPINGNHFLQPTINNDNLPQQQQQPQLKRPQPSNFINGANFTEHPFDDTKNDSSLSNHHLDATKQQAKNQRNNSKSNAMNNKKSVKFSDHIELVACADDDEQEEPLPNLLLEKVLIGKNLIYTLQQ